MVWLRCPNKCIFEDETRPDWDTGTMNVYPMMTCPVCHRQAPNTSFVKTSGKATATVDEAHKISTGRMPLDGVREMVKCRLSKLLGIHWIMLPSRTERSQHVLDPMFDRIVGLLVEAELTSNFPTPRIWKLLESGCMKNMWEFHQSGYDDAGPKDKYAEERDEGERTLFGASSPSFAGARPAAADRPIYVVLSVGSFLPGGAPMYGQSYLVFNDQLKLRSTFCATDSLQLIKQGTKASAKDVYTYSDIAHVLLKVSDSQLMYLYNIASGKATAAAVEFIECHAWGPVTIEQDVKAIVVSESDLEEFVTMKERDVDTVFPPELKGQSDKARRVSVDLLKKHLTAFCRERNIELHLLKLSGSTMNSKDKRPVK